MMGVAERVVAEATGGVAGVGGAGGLGEAGWLGVLGVLGKGASPIFFSGRCYFDREL